MASCDTFLKSFFLYGLVDIGRAGLDLGGDDGSPLLSEFFADIRRYS